MKRLSLKDPNKRGKGFTLIEVLIVIVIFGILFAIIFITVGDIRMKSRNTKRETDMDQVNKALQIYRNVVGSYPDCDYNGLSILAPDYIGELPQDPLGGDYWYEYSLGADGYTLIYYTEPDHTECKVTP